MDTARYYLVEPFGDGRELEIEAKAYVDLARAHVNLVALRQIEESFSLAADSFIAFEAELLFIALDYEYRRDGHKDRRGEFDKYRRRINLSLFTFLTATKAYQDHLKRQASNNETDLGITLREVAKFLSENFDASLEYRVMESLRNQAVHARLPLDFYSLGSKNQWKDDNVSQNVPSRKRVTADPAISCSIFCASDKGNANVRQEVAALGHKYLDLKYFVRGYIAQTSRGHINFRERTKAAFQVSTTAIQSVKDDLWLPDAPRPSNISIEKRVDGAAPIRHLVDPEDFSELSRLREEWSHLQHAQRAYVSSEINRRSDTFPFEHGDVWIAF